MFLQQEDPLLLVISFVRAINLFLLFCFKLQRTGIRFRPNAGPNGSISRNLRINTSLGNVEELVTSPQIFCLPSTVALFAGRQKKPKCG